MGLDVPVPGLRQDGVPGGAGVRGGQEALAQEVYHLRRERLQVELSLTTANFPSLMSGLCITDKLLTNWRTFFQISTFHLSQQRVV